MEINEFELGNHCFGEILRVNGRDYEDLTKEEIMGFILDRFENDINSGSLIKDVFKNCLEYLQYDSEETDSSHCDQCGNWNYYSRYTP